MVAEGRFWVMISVARFSHSLQASRTALSVVAAIKSAFVKFVGAPYEKMTHISGNDVKRRKPAPDLFLLAADRMGLQPGWCVVIEDAPDGVLAAKAAGAKCIAVTNTTNATNLADADSVCDSLEQIDLDTVRRLID